MTLKNTLNIVNGFPDNIAKIFISLKHTHTENALIHTCSLKKEFGNHFFIPNWERIV